MGNVVGYTIEIVIDGITKWCALSCLEEMPADEITTLVGKDWPEAKIIKINKVYND